MGTAGGWAPPPLRAARAATVAVVVVGLLTGLSACAPQEASAPAPATGTAISAPVDEATDALADGITVEAVQARLDWGRRVMGLAITAPDAADGGGPTDPEVDVVAAALGSPAWTTTTPSNPDRTVTLAPGRTRSMFVELGDPVCDASPGGRPDGVTGPGGTARLTLEAADGATIERDVPVTDPYGHLARAWGEDCARTAFERVARLAIGPDVVSGDHEGAVTGTVTLTITPIGASEARPAVFITGISGTQLLAPVGGTPWRDPALGAPDAAGSAVPLTFTAVRCDQHAIAEDKRGTYLGIETSRDGVAQPVFHVQLPEETRRALMTWFAGACSWES